jgi:hypothetical protein
VLSYSICFIGVAIFLLNIFAKLSELISIPLEKMIRMPLLPLQKHKMLIKLSIRRRNEAMLGSKVSKHILHNLLKNMIM